MRKKLALLTAIILVLNSLISMRLFADDTDLVFEDYAPLNKLGGSSVTVLSQVGSAIKAYTANGSSERMGVQLKKPMKLTDGFSIDFSLNEFGVETVDDGPWFMVALSTILPEGPNYYDWGMFNQSGSGIGFMIKPVSSASSVDIIPLRFNMKANGTLDLNPFVYASVDGVTSKRIAVPNFENITLAMIPNGSGGYDVKLNNGSSIFTDKFNWTGILMGASVNCYARFMAYNPTALPFEFTLNQINGEAAARIVQRDVTGITLNKSKMTIYRNDSVPLEAKTVPENATDPTVLWSNSNPSVAVYSGGSVKALSPGTTTLTAITQDGGFSKQCVITVPETDEKLYKSDWGPFDYWAGVSNRPVKSTLAVNASGISVEGEQSGGDGGVGAVLRNGFDLKKGFSVNFSLDDYPADSPDMYFAIQLLDREKAVNPDNPAGAYTEWGSGYNNSITCGAGLVFLMRIHNSDEKQILLQTFWNAVNESYMAQGGQWRFVSEHNPGIVIDLDNFSDIKFQITPRAEGGYDIIFNDGNFSVGGMLGGYAPDGTANPGNKLEGIDTFFAEKRTWFGFSAKNIVDTHMKFSIFSVNGSAASGAGENRPGSIIENKPALPEKLTGVYELLPDTMFQNGFEIQKLSHFDDGPYNVGHIDYGNSALTPKWNLCQWDSRYSFADYLSSMKEISKNVFKYSTPAQSVTVDRNTGQLGLFVDASKIYDTPRPFGQAWTHLLAEVFRFNYTQEDRQKTAIGNMDHLRFQTKLKLTEYENLMSPTEYNRNLHSTQFVLFFQIVPLNDPDPMSNLMWFGTTFFDFRKEFPSQNLQIDSGKDDASGRVIFSIGARDYMTGSFFKDANPYGSPDNDWIDVDVDLLPYVKLALSKAQEEFGQMHGYTVDDLYINEMNIGWEVTGTFKNEMQLKDLSLKMYSNAAYDGNSEISSKNPDVEINGSTVRIKSSLEGKITVGELKKMISAPDEHTLIFVNDIGEEMDDSEIVTSLMTIRLMRGILEKAEYGIEFVGSVNNNPITKDSILLYGLASVLLLSSVTAVYFAFKRGA